MDRRALYTAIGVAAAVTFSAPALAQSSGTQLERRCDDFAWLLGTWTSYSPWGDHTDPTGGTLVFTMSADGSVEGRLTSLNQYAEEYGYREGMIVFRAFREVYHYGPDGTTRHESRDGEFYVIDVTASYDPDQQRGYWEPGVIGVINGTNYLYLNPTGRAHLSNHGEWLKRSGSTETRAPDACSPEPETGPEQPAPPDDYGTSIAEALPREMLERMLDPTDPLPPVILNPDRCQLREEANEGGQPSRQRLDLPAVEERLASLRYRFANEADAMAVAEYVPLIEALEEEFAALVLASSLETSPERRRVFSERREEISLILSRYATIQPSPEGVPAASPGCAYRPEPILVDMTPDDEELQILSVRQNATTGYRPVYQDPEIRFANLRDGKEQLETTFDGIDFNNPDADELASYAESMRQYQRLLRLHEQEAEALRLLVESDKISEDDRRRYQAQLGQYLGELSELGELHDAFFDQETQDGEADRFSTWGFDLLEDDSALFEEFSESLRRSEAAQVLDARLSEAFRGGYVLERKGDYLTPGHARTQN